MPALWAASSMVRRTLRGSTAVPNSVVNTRPLSVQLVTRLQLLGGLGGLADLMKLRVVDPFQVNYDGAGVRAG